MPKRKIEVNEAEVREDGKRGLERVQHTLEKLRNAPNYILFSAKDPTKEQLETIEKYRTEDNGKKYRNGLEEQQSISEVFEKLECSQEVLDNALADEKKIRSYVYAKRLIEEEDERSRIEDAFVKKYGRATLPLPRLTQHLYRIGDDEATQKYNEALFHKINDPERNHLVIKEVMDKFMDLDMGELKQALDEGDDAILAYYEEHREELEFTFLIYSTVRDMNGGLNLGRVPGHSFEFSDEFQNVVNNCSGIIESLSSIKSRIQLMGTPEYLASEGLENLGGLAAYTFGATHLQAHVKEADAVKFSQLLMNTKGSTVEATIAGCEKYGIPFDKHTLTGYAAYVIENGAKKEVHLSDVFNGKYPDAKVERRSPEEESKVREVVSLAEKDTLRRQELRPVTGKLAEYNAAMKKNSMFFSFMQSSQYSKFETAYANFRKQVERNASAKDLEASMVELRIRAQKYLQYKGEPKASDKRGIDRVTFVRQLESELADLGIEDHYKTTELASDANTANAMNNFEDMKKAEQLTGKKMGEGTVQEAHKLAENLGMVGEDIQVNVDDEPNRNEVNGLEGEIKEDEKNYEFSEEFGEQLEKQQEEAQKQGEPEPQ